MLLNQVEACISKKVFWLSLASFVVMLVSNVVLQLELVDKQRKSKTKEELRIGIFEELEQLSVVYANNPREIIVLANELLALDKAECDAALEKYINGYNERAENVLLLIPILYPDNLQVSDPPVFFDGTERQWRSFCGLVVLIEDIPFVTRSNPPYHWTAEIDEIRNLVKWCQEHGIRRERRLCPSANPFRVIENLDAESLLSDKRYSNIRSKDELDDAIAIMRCQAAMLVRNLLPREFRCSACEPGVPERFRDSNNPQWKSLLKFGDLICWNFIEYTLSENAFEILTRLP